MGVIQNCLLLEMDPPSGRGAWHPHRSKRIITCRCDPVGCDSPAFLACPCRHGQCHFARKRLPNHFDLRLFDAWEKIFPKLVIYIPCQNPFKKNHLKHIQIRDLSSTIFQAYSIHLGHFCLFFSIGFCVFFLTTVMVIG